MSLWRQISRGVGNLVNGPRSDKEIADEVDDFVSRATAANVERGLSPEESRRRAKAELGSTLSVREQVRSYGWENRFETVLADMRYTIRNLCSTPGFALVVILTLALGIGPTPLFFRSSMRL